MADVQIQEIFQDLERRISAMGETLKLNQVQGRLAKELRTLAEFYQETRGDVQEWVDATRGNMEDWVEETRGDADVLTKAMQEDVRRVITGSDTKTLEEYLRDEKVVKLQDKVTFVFGVFMMVGTQLTAMLLPRLFPVFFVLFSIGFMIHRTWSYGKKNMHYFMLDYCYVINTMCVINVFAFKVGPLWKMNFAAANGPLIWAVVAWRNSLVFHSLDKIASLFIHMGPAILTFLARHYDGTESAMCDNGKCSMSFLHGFVLPMAVYFTWQSLYLVQTEIIDRKKFERDPTLMTSLRWIIRDRKNGVHRLMKRMARELGMLKKDEHLDTPGKEWVPLTLFVACQLLFTAFTFLLAWPMFYSSVLHLGFIIFVLLSATWNGANFYFEVFAHRYVSQLKESAEKYRRQREAKEKDGEEEEEEEGDLVDFELDG